MGEINNSVHNVCVSQCECVQPHHYSFKDVFCLTGLIHNYLRQLLNKYAVFDYRICSCIAGNSQCLLTKHSLVVSKRLSHLDILHGQRSTARHGVVVETFLEGC